MSDNMKPKLTDVHRELLIRAKYASDLSPVGGFILVGNECGESRVIPDPGNVTDEESDAIIAAAFAIPEISLDQIKRPA